MTERTISAEERRATRWAVAMEGFRLVQCPGCWTAAMGRADVDWECECGEAMTVVDLRSAHLSAWVSGDVARARELAEGLRTPLRQGQRAMDELGWTHANVLAHENLAEIVALLTPKATE